MMRGETLLQAKTPLLVAETQTKVLTDSMSIAARAPDHCTT